MDPKKKTKIELKAAPQWWSEDTQVPAPSVVVFYKWVVVHVDGKFVLEVDEEHAEEEVRAKMIAELKVDDSEKETSKEVEAG